MALRSGRPYGSARRRSHPCSKPDTSPRYSCSIRCKSRFVFHIGSGHSIDQRTSSLCRRLARDQCTRFCSHTTYWMPMGAFLQHSISGSCSAREAPRCSTFACLSCLLLWLYFSLEDCAISFVAYLLFVQKS